MYLNKFFIHASIIAMALITTNAMAQKLVFQYDENIDDVILRGATLDGKIKFFEHGRPQPYSVENNTLSLYDSNWEVYKTIKKDDFLPVIGKDSRLEAPQFFDFDNEAPCDQHQEYVLTQTLFNDDLNYEFIVQEYSKYNEEGAYFSKDTKCFKIINDKGDVLCTINRPADLPATKKTELYVRWIGRIFGKLYICLGSKGSKDYLYELNISGGTLGVKSIKNANKVMRFLRSAVPTDNNLTIEIDQPLASAHNVTLADASGRIVAQCVLPQGERLVKFSTHGLASGIYLVALSSNGKVIDSGKVVVK